MESLDRFLEYRVQGLFERGLVSRADELPVNLGRLATAAGVLSIEERSMIPEAVLAAERTGFRIYLQNNFAQSPGFHTRQRFSLAHEIAHTFFYELREGKRRSIQGAPKGDALEDACHQGAGLLLVPQRSLTRELRLIDGPVGARHAIQLSRKFDVSAEVIVRRLNEVGAFESTDTALVLVRRSAGGAMIEYAVYPPWLKSVLPTPHRGTNFASWLRHASSIGRSDFALAELIESGLQGKTTSGVLRVDSFDVTRSQQIFELRI